MGFEYYGALGPVTGFDPFRDQQQQLIPCVDLNSAPIGSSTRASASGSRTTPITCCSVILGRRFDFHRKSNAEAK
jgi:hypothetical protein